MTLVVKGRSVKSQGRGREQPGGEEEGATRTQEPFEAHLMERL